MQVRSQARPQQLSGAALNVQPVAPVMMIVSAPVPDVAAGAGSAARLAASSRFTLIRSRIIAPTLSFFTVPLV